MLSVNLGLAMLSLLLWLGYLLYANYAGGWERVVGQADVFLLLLPPYYFGASWWVARRRLPLERVPAARLLGGLAYLSGGLLACFWLLGRLRIIVFSFLPFPILVGIVIGCLAIAYYGWRALSGPEDR